MTPTERLLWFFQHSHLPEGRIRNASGACADHAAIMEVMIPDGPEKTAGMRKLLEAKDCFVRAAVEYEARAAGRHP